VGVTNAKLNIAWGRSVDSDWQIAITLQIENYPDIFHYCSSCLQDTTLEKESAGWVIGTWGRR
jgi:hypothetical protein